MPTTHTFFQHIETATGYTLVTGYPCGGQNEPCVPPNNRPYFRPGDNVTRGQAAKIVYLMEQGNFRHSQAYEGSNNFNHSANTYTEPRGFLIAKSPYVSQYNAEARSLMWTAAARQRIINGSYSSDVVFHSFLANTNNCPTAYAYAWSNNFSGAIPAQDVWCSGVRNEIRFRVNGPYIIAGVPGYTGHVLYDAPTYSEKGEITIANYYNDPINRRKDTMRKFCFYAFNIGWTDRYALCHQ